MLGSVTGWVGVAQPGSNRDTFEADLFKSAGIGLRYQSPFGPFRLDFAFPLDRRPTDPSSKIYFGFGSVF